MRYIDEYRDPERVRKLVELIKREVENRWKVMEVCGGQTHSILRFGIDQLVNDKVELLHGPGCPVCVTPVEMIDKAIVLAKRGDVILTTFGDMLRVPGSCGSLLSAVAQGANVKVIYSPMDNIRIAMENRERQVVFFAVGFETTAPATAVMIRTAEKFGLDNLSVLCAHILIPPALELLLSRTDNTIQGLLAPGHVCTVTGYRDYEIIAKRYGVPIVVTGFEPYDILYGLYKCLKLLEAGKAVVENAYPRSVYREGNREALELIETVFEVEDRMWRGIGVIPRSGLRISEKYRNFDAENRFELPVKLSYVESGCIAGQVLQGIKKPIDCPHFGKECKPDTPMGAPMVSSEGACAAYYKYYVGRQFSIGG